MRPGLQSVVDGGASTASGHVEASRTTSPKPSLLLMVPGTPFTTILYSPAPYWQQAFLVFVRIGHFKGVRRSQAMHAVSHTVPPSLRKPPVECQATKVPVLSRRVQPTSTNEVIRHDEANVVLETAPTLVLRLRWPATYVSALSQSTFRLHCSSKSHRSSPSDLVLSRSAFPI
jgi:hypothetical protein